jgi:hypothetical protein
MPGKKTKAKKASNKDVETKLSDPEIKGKKKRKRSDASSTDKSESANKEQPKKKQKKEKKAEIMEQKQENKKEKEVWKKKSFTNAPSSNTSFFSPIPTSCSTFSPSTPKYSPFSTPTKTPISSVPHSTQSSRLSMGQSKKLMPEKRFTTLIGKQGEHVSAYSLYEELVLSTLQRTNAKEAVNSLQEGVACIASGFNGQQKQTLKRLHEKFFDVIDNNISREERQFVKAALTKRKCSKKFTGEFSKKTSSINLEKIEEKIDVALRNSNKANLLEVADQIVDVILQATNKMQYVCFPKEGGAQAPSRDEKTLKNDLRALDNWLFKLYDCDSINDATVNNAISIDNQLIRREIKRGYKYAGYSFAQKLSTDQPEMVIKSKQGKTNKHGKKSTSSGKSATNKIDNIITYDKQKKFIEEIADKIQLLFWYPMIRSGLIPEEKWEEKAGLHGYNKYTAFRTNKLDILYQVAARHIVLIFNCYKGLTYLPEDMQKAIVDNFLEYLLNKPKSGQNGDYGQGWCECSEFGNCDDPDKKIILKEGIEKYAKLDYTGRQFKMYDDSELKYNTEDDTVNLSGFSEITGEESYSFTSQFS